MATLRARINVLRVDGIGIKVAIVMVFYWIRILVAVCIAVLFPIGILVAVRGLSLVTEYQYESGYIARRVAASRTVVTIKILVTMRVWVLVRIKFTIWL